MPLIHIDTIKPRVVDLSHYDDVQDKFAGAVKFGIWGVINKVTEGVGSVDRSFNWRRQPAKDAGLLYGAYHFIWASNRGAIDRQITNFLDAIGNPAGLLLALDHESEGSSNPSEEDARAWLGGVHDKVGRWPWIYSSNLLKEQVGNSLDPFWKNIKLWLAQYSSSGNYAWPPAFEQPPLIQYTGDGAGRPPHNVPGIVISGGLDINHFDGTRDELAAIWAT